MSEFERIALWVAIVSGVMGTIFNGIQVLLQWFTLREVGDLDHDRTDWWEKMPWRKKG
jgi:hypothetical protein